MEGKKEYIRAVYEVVQELMRQLLINNGNGFDYVPQSSRGVAQYADINEQLKILSALEKHGVIELRSPRDWAQWSGEADYTTYEVVATRKKLEKYASKLRKLLQPINESSESSNGRIPCVLRLHDIELHLSERTSLSNWAKLARTCSMSLPVVVSPIGSVADHKIMSIFFRMVCRAMWSCTDLANLSNL